MHVVPPRLLTLLALAIAGCSSIRTFHNNPFTHPVPTDTLFLVATIVHPFHVEGFHTKITKSLKENELAFRLLQEDAGQRIQGNLVEVIEENLGIPVVEAGLLAERGTPGFRRTLIPYYGPTELFVPNGRKFITPSILLQGASLCPFSLAPGDTIITNDGLFSDPLTSRPHLKHILNTINRPSMAVLEIWPFPIQGLRIHTGVAPGIGSEGAGLFVGASAANKEPIGFAFSLSFYRYGEKSGLSAGGSVLLAKTDGNNIGELNNEYEKINELVRRVEPRLHKIMRNPKKKIQ